MKSEMATKQAASRLPTPTPIVRGIASSHPAAAPPASDAGMAASRPSYRVGVVDGVSVT
jgi:hypothetical protein